MADAMTSCQQSSNYSPVFGQKFYMRAPNMIHRIQFQENYLLDDQIANKVAKSQDFQSIARTFRLTILLFDFFFN